MEKKNPVDRFEQFRKAFDGLTDPEKRFLVVLSSMVDPTNDELEFKIDPEDPRLAEVTKGGDPIVQLRDCFRGLLNKTLHVEDMLFKQYIAWIVILSANYEENEFMVAICPQIRPYLLHLNQLNLSF
jgi:hypothetical protein